MDLKTGKYKWTLTVPGELDHPPSVSPNRVAFVHGSRAVVVNRTTGARTSSGLYYDLPSWPSATPALTDTTIYVPTYIENKLQTVDLARGLSGWSYRTRGLVATTPLIAGSGAGHSLIMAAEDGLVVALPARDATEPAPRNESWTARTFGTFDLDPVEHGDLVYIASSDSSLYAFNSIGGSIMWRYITGGEWRGELAVGGDTVFARTDRDWLALDAATGAVKWTAGDLEKFIVRMGDHVIIKSSGGGGYSRRRASDGAEVGHFQSPLMKNVPVNSTGDLLVFGDGLGTIYALK
jgi:outer membrane protein assembly factor BamB